VVSPRRASLLLVLALALAACGQSGDRAAARSVTEAFLAAYEAGDGADACAQLSSDTRTAVESQEQAACARAVTALDLDGGAVARVEVYVTNAKVDLTTGESAFLSEESDGWRLSALGCRPNDGKPADRPFECELEA
jgi:hypothetical protein